jgi:hypothetical protein
VEISTADANVEPGSVTHAAREEVKLRDRSAIVLRRLGDER